MTDLLTIGFFQIRAVRRQVMSPHTASRFSAWYKARIQAGDLQYPVEQAYEDWLDAFRSWYELDEAEGNEPDAETVLLLPGMPQPGDLPRGGPAPRPDDATGVHPARDHVSGREQVPDRPPGREGDD